MSAWLITAAMRAEAKLLTPRLSRIDDIGRKTAYEGELAGREVLLMLTGMGQVNAAQATTAALETRPHIAAVLNLGCAGAYASSGLELGSAAIATEVVFADLGVRAKGSLRDFSLVGIPLCTGHDGDELYNRLPCDPGLTEEIAAANPGIARGGFATVERISGDAEAAQAVAARWGAIMEEMEGAAVGLVALHYAKPFAALRGVSNMAGHRELDVALGGEAAARALLNLEARA